MEPCLSLRSPWPNVTIPEANVADYVWENVAQYSENTALVCGLTGRWGVDLGRSTCIRVKHLVRSYTYGVARGMAMKFGSALTRLGGKRGDVMGMVRITFIKDVPGLRIEDPVE